jgi:hypothetical protein
VALSCCRTHANTSGAGDGLAAVRLVVRGALEHAASTLMATTQAGERIVERLTSKKEKSWSAEM